MPDPEIDAAQESLARLADFRSQTNQVPVEMKRRLRERYLATPRDEKLREAIDDALHDLGICRKDGSRFEARGVVVTGGSGSGKSHAVLRVLKKHPLFPGFGQRASGCIALGVRCKGSFTLGRLGAAISKAAGYPLASHLHENIVWDKTRGILRTRGIVLLYVDEFNSLLRNANSKERDKIIDTIKGLQNDEDWPVTVVLSGTTRIREIIGAHDPDDELTRRMHWMPFHPLQLPRDNKMIASHVGALSRDMGLVFDEQSFASDLAPRLIHAARYQLGSSIEISISAIEYALRKQAGRLVKEHYATAFARESKVTPSNNPFLVADWASVKIYCKDDEEFGPPVPKQRTRRRDK